VLKRVAGDPGRRTRCRADSADVSAGQPDG
jgi:hypothetical protein